MADVATVGVLVTLPAKWGAGLQFIAHCPDCGASFSARGAGSFSDVAVYINHHTTNECPRRADPTR